MPFEMIAGEERTYIDSNEEGIFLLAQGDKAYPQLNILWECFYKNPKIYPDIANTLANELDYLRVYLGNSREHKIIAAAIDRISPFLKRAYENYSVVSCESD